jgi:hypothetical protein
MQWGTRGIKTFFASFGNRTQEHGCMYRPVFTIETGPDDPSFPIETGVLLGLGERIVH